MAIVELTAENFNEVVEKNPITIIDFWAPWCGPCRQFAPIYEKVAQEYPDIAFGKVNTEEQQELAGYFRIQSIPTIMIIREGVVVFNQAGMLPEEALKDVIEQVKALDMEQVKKEIAEAEAKENNSN